MYKPVSLFTRLMTLSSDSWHYILLMTPLNITIDKATVANANASPALGTDWTSGVGLTPF